MMICRICKNVFDYPEHRESESLEHFGTLCHYSFSVCPYCGSEDIAEAAMCAQCGIVCAEDEIAGGLCRQCRKALQDKIQTFKQGLELAELKFIYDEWDGEVEI